jgi:hypothetical protein
MPEYIELKLGPQTSTTDTSVTGFSHGWATASNQSVDSIYEDSTGREQQASTSNCIMLRKKVSGTMTDRVKASFVSFDEITPGTTYSFTLNFTTVDANRQIRYIVHG